MDEVQITLKSAAPAGSSDAREQVTASKGFFAVRWVQFMLARPRPVDEAEDIRAARAALDESEERIPYEQIRRELGLG